MLTHDRTAPYAASVRARATIEAGGAGVYRFVLTNCEVMGSHPGVVFKTLRSEDVPAYCANGTNAESYAECVDSVPRFLPNKLLVQLNYTMMNPGGSFISSEDEPVIGLYLFFAVCWGALCLAWCANVGYWALYHRPVHNNKSSTAGHRATLLHVAVSIAIC